MKKKSSAAKKAHKSRAKIGAARYESDIAKKAAATRKKNKEQNKAGI